MKLYVGFYPWLIQGSRPLRSRSSGREAVLESLNDSVLKVKVLMSEPQNLEESLKAAQRIEAYEGKTPGRDETADKGRRAATLATRASADASTKEEENDGLESLRLEMAGLQSSFER